MRVLASISSSVGEAPPKSNTLAAIILASFSQMLSEHETEYGNRKSECDDWESAYNHLEEAHRVLTNERLESLAAPTNERIKDLERELEEEKQRLVDTERALENMD